MRCSSCEPLLAAYLESALRHRRALEVAEHLRECHDCASLLGELKVIDALLVTARPPGSVGGDFTASVVSATHATPARARRRPKLLIPLVLYLAAAWAAAAFFALRADHLPQIGAALLAAQARNLAGLGEAARALAPATPIVAAAVSAVLALDLLLLGALLFGYRRLRPLLAAHLSRGSRS